MMLNGVGMGDSEMKKIQLIKRLTNQGYNLQVMAAKRKGKNPQKNHGLKCQNDGHWIQTILPIY